MVLGLKSTYLDVPHARRGVERFLAERKPHSTRAYVERVLARTLEVQRNEPKEELALLLLLHRRYTAGLELALETGALASHMGSAMQLLWLLHRHRLETEPLTRLILTHLDRGLETAAAWQEPFRAEIFRWARLLKLYEGELPIARPLDPELGAHFDLQAILFQTRFGGRPTLRGELGPAYRRLMSALTTDVVSSELLVGALLVELSLAPADADRAGWLLAKLLSRQTIDGGFVVKRPDLMTEHQTVCLATAALSRLS